MATVVSPTHYVAANLLVDPRQLPANKQWGQRFVPTANSWLKNIRLKMQDMSRQFDFETQLLDGFDNGIITREPLANATSSLYEYNSGISGYYCRIDFPFLTTVAGRGYSIQFPVRGVIPGTGTGPDFTIVASDLNGGSGQSESMIFLAANLTTTATKSARFATPAAWVGVRFELRTIVSHATPVHTNGQDIIYFNDWDFKVFNGDILDYPSDFDGVRCGIIVRDASGNFVTRSTNTIDFDSISTTAQDVDFVFDGTVMLTNGTPYIFQVYTDRSVSATWGNWSTSYGSPNDNIGQLNGVPSVPFTFPLSGQPVNLLRMEDQNTTHFFNEASLFEFSYGPSFSVLDFGPLQSRYRYTNTGTLNSKVIIWGGSIVDGSVHSWIPVKKNQQYTVSFWAYGIVGTTNALWPITLQVGCDLAVFASAVISITLGSYAQYSLTFTTTNTDAFKKLDFRLSMNNTVNALTSPAEFLMSGLSLVEGATPPSIDNVGLIGGRYGVGIHATSLARSTPAGSYASGNLQSKAIDTAWADGQADLRETAQSVDLLFQITYDTISSTPEDTFVWSGDCSTQVVQMAQLIEEIEEAADAVSAILDPPLQINRSVEPTLPDFIAAYGGAIPDHVRFIWADDFIFAGEYIAKEGDVLRLENYVYPGKSIFYSNPPTGLRVTMTATAGAENVWSDVTLPKPAKIIMSPHFTVGILLTGGAIAALRTLIRFKNTTAAAYPTDYDLALFLAAGTDTMVSSKTLRWFIAELAAGDYDFSGIVVDPTVSVRRSWEYPLQLVQAFGSTFDIKVTIEPQLEVIYGTDV